MEMVMARQEKKRRDGPGLRSYFERLRKEKQVRVEDVASQLGRSFSTVNALKYGRTKPDVVMILALEAKYGIPVE